MGRDENTRADASRPTKGPQSRPCPAIFRSWLRFPFSARAAQFPRSAGSGRARPVFPILTTIGSNETAGNRSSDTQPPGFRPSRSCANAGRFGAPSSPKR